jgi:hypothetical protein
MKCGKGTVDLYSIALVWTLYHPYGELPVKRETKLCKECLGDEDNLNGIEKIIMKNKKANGK